MANIWRVLQNVVDCFQSTMAPCPAPSVEVWCCPCINKQTTIMHYPYESTYLKHNVWLELITFWKWNNSFRRSIFNDEKAYVFAFAYNYVTKYMMKYRMCFCIRLLVHFFMVMLQKHTKLEITRSHHKINVSEKKKKISHASNSVFLFLLIRCP